MAGIPALMAKRVDVGYDIDGTAPPGSFGLGTGSGGQGALVARAVAGLALARRRRREE